ncbi:hypothetical protein PRIC1_005927 [Phytophthora ramorum]
MIRRRRQWRQQEREKAVRNVFESQMHARMRRQSLKHAEIRAAEDVETDCVTIDLGSARSRESCRLPEQQPDKSKVKDVRGTQWVPHSIEEEFSSSSSESESVAPMKHNKLENDLVLRVLQPLSQDATFRLERLGDLDLQLAVPTFVYRVFLSEDDNQYSGDATEGSAGIHRLPRLLHNSRVNLPPRPAHCYL